MQQELEIIQGVIGAIVFQNQENGNAVLRQRIMIIVVAVILAYRGKSLLTVSLAASAAVMLTEWALALFA